MFAALKRIANLVWLYSAFTGVSLSRLFSSLGSALFTLRKFTILLVGTIQTAFFIPAAVVLLTSNFILNLGTRIPAIYHMIFPKKSPMLLNEIEQPLLIDDELERHSDEENVEAEAIEEVVVDEVVIDAQPIISPVEPTSAETESHNIRNGAATTTYYALKLVGLISATFVAFNSYLGFITLWEFATSEASSLRNPKHPYDSDNEEYMIQAIALILAVFNYAANTSYNIKKYNSNAKILSNAIKDGEVNLDKKATVKAAAIATPAIIAGSLLANFSTTGSLEKVPSWIKIPSLAKKIIADVSSVTAPTNQALTSGFSTYRKFITDEVYYENPPSWEKVFIPTMKTVGTVDCIGTVISNFVAIDAVMGELLDIEQDNYYLMGASLLVSLCIGYITYNFNILEAAKNTVGIWHDRRGDKPVKRTAVVEEMNDEPEVAVVEENSFHMKDASNLSKHSFFSHSSTKALTEQSPGQRSDTFCFSNVTV